MKMLTGGLWTAKIRVKVVYCRGTYEDAHCWTMEDKGER